MLKHCLFSICLLQIPVLVLFPPLVLPSDADAVNTELWPSDNRSRCSDHLRQNGRWLMSPVRLGDQLPSDRSCCTPVNETALNLRTHIRTQPFGHTLEPVKCAGDGLHTLLGCIHPTLYTFRRIQRILAVCELVVCSRGWNSNDPLPRINPWCFLSLSPWWPKEWISCDCPQRDARGKHRDGQTGTSSEDNL